MFTSDLSHSCLLDLLFMFTSIHSWKKVCTDNSSYVDLHLPVRILRIRNPDACTTRWQRPSVCLILANLSSHKPAFICRARVWKETCNHEAIVANHRPPTTLSTSTRERKYKALSRQNRALLTNSTQHKSGHKT